jgi:hypothetical protein
MDIKKDSTENLGALHGYAAFLADAKWVKEAGKAMAGCRGDGFGYDVDHCHAVIYDLVARLVAIGEWAQREEDSLGDQAHQMDYGVFSGMKNMVNEVKDILEA